MFAQYKLVASDENTLGMTPSARSYRTRSFWTAGLAVVSLLNVCMLVSSFHFWATAGAVETTSPNALPVTLAAPVPPISSASVLNIPDGIAKVEALPVAYVPFFWRTPWGAPNATEADSLWDNINTAHGHIAVDHDWAAANNWPPSMDTPGKPGKGMYLIQAYHQLHCLRIVRSIMLSFHRQTPPQYPIHHALHCFDALRQHIMCHADNTPLYGHGDGTAGDGQMHQCKDWNALRDYATRNTACFRDGKPGMSFLDRFGICDDGTDGLEPFPLGNSE